MWLLLYGVTVTNRIQALDGLRGVAVILVVIGHGVTVPNSAGSVGVTVFFVLSGFLITRILERDIDQHGGVRLRRFFIRRARRLLPALAVLVLVSGFVFYAAGRLGWWWHTVWPAITYTSDFVTVAGGSERMTWMEHTWSLSVEEHFYLVWPFVVTLIARKSWRIWVTLLIVAVAWRLHLNANPQRAYFSTDGNAYALVLGGVLAHVRLQVSRSVVPYGLAALIVLSLAGVTAGRTWVPVAAAVVSAIVLAASLDGAPILEAPWLRWFGTISYGLYLWHFPFMSLWPGHGLEFGVLAVCIAASSWYLWERRWLTDRSAPSDLAARRVRERGGSARNPK